MADRIEISVDVQENTIGQKRGRGDETRSITFGDQTPEDTRHQANFVESTQTNWEPSSETRKVKEGIENVLLNARNLLKNITKHQVLLESESLEIKQRQHEMKKQLAKFASANGMCSMETTKVFSLQNSVKSSSWVEPMVQQKGDDGQLKLAEQQKMELENLHQRILDLDSQLKNKQGLALEHGTLKCFHAACEDVREKEEELVDLQALTHALAVRERRATGELHEAREEVINVLKELPNSSHIGTKRVGELKTLSFLEACKQKYPEEIAVVKAVKLCSLWEANLRDPEWYPFKTIMSDGVYKVEMDLEDVKLKNLEDEWGEDVYIAVTDAMRELIEYNPGERLHVTELWNYKLGRKATLGEAAEFMLQKWKTMKRRRSMT